MRGRGIGGSSAINALVALPGDPDDYDEWAYRYGCAGWGWVDVGEWFGRIPIPLLPAAPDELGPMNRALLAADPVATTVPLTRSTDGRRASVNDVYLEPARRRTNLTIRGDALVDRVLWDGRAAAGVRLADGNEVEAGTVVVCAGAIHSPAILMRSDVDRSGIGANLHDHPAFPIPFALHTADARPHPAAPPGDVPLPIAVVARHTSGAEPHDLQVLAMDGADPQRPELAVLMVALMRVHSRGSVRLASNDPLDDPVVSFEMLSDERDWPPLRRGIVRAEALLARAAFTAIGDVLAHDSSDAGVLAAVGDYVHAAGSCRMGPPDDAGAVVDPYCRVIGYQGLFVCDASVMPNAPRVNTHLPTVMIAERVAAWMKAAPGPV